MQQAIVRRRFLQADEMAPLKPQPADLLRRRIVRGDTDAGGSDEALDGAVFKGDIPQDAGAVGVTEFDDLAAGGLAPAPAELAAPHQHVAHDGAGGAHAVRAKIADVELQRGGPEVRAVKITVLHHDVAALVDLQPVRLAGPDGDAGNGHAIAMGHAEEIARVRIGEVRRLHAQILNADAAARAKIRHRRLIAAIDDAHAEAGRIDSLLREAPQRGFSHPRARERAAHRHLHSFVAPPAPPAIRRPQAAGEHHLHIIDPGAEPHRTAAFHRAGCLQRRLDGRPVIHAIIHHRTVAFR